MAASSSAKRIFFMFTSSRGVLTARDATKVSFFTDITGNAQYTEPLNQRNDSKELRLVPDVYLYTI